MVGVMQNLASMIEQINQAMTAVLARDEELVARIGTYSFEGGGKRLRPLIFSLVTEALGSPLTSQRLETAVAFEFLHMATLLHDDIIDEAQVRRGRAATHLAFGVPETILAGDYLLANAALLSVAEGNLANSRILAEIVATMSVGEMVQLSVRRKVDLTLDEYLNIIYRKTAALFEGAAHGAAVLAGADVETQAHLKAYGRKLGLAFQIMDDVLDYQSDEATFGKPVGHDLDEGKITLPFIKARESLAAEAKERLEQLAAMEPLGASEKDEIISLVRKGRGVESAVSMAENLIFEAVESLQKLPPSEAKEKLIALASFTVERNK